MNVLSENSVPAITGNEAILPFQVFATHPSSITYHWIWDHELDKLVNISRPITLGLATLFAGAVIGLLPSVFEAFDYVAGGKVLDGWALALCMVAALCLAAAVACGIFAHRGQLDAQSICADVRSRNLTAVSSPTERDAGGSQSTGGPTAYS